MEQCPYYYRDKLRNRRLKQKSVALLDKQTFRTNNNEPPLIQEVDSNEYVFTTLEPLDYEIEDQLKTLGWVARKTQRPTLLYEFRYPLKRTTYGVHTLSKIFFTSFLANVAMILLSLLILEKMSVCTFSWFF